METERTAGESLTHRWDVGGIEVLTLNDGVAEVSLSNLQGGDTTGSGRLPEAAGGKTRRNLQMNLFLLRLAGRLALVDSGGGAARPGLGHLPAALRAADVAPGGIDAVLMTHLHSDHVGGLTTAEGGRAFPNAELVVAELETAYWLDRGMAARVPESRRASFDAARAALRPYEGAIRTFNGETEVLPGVFSVPLAGHTHGHTGYRLRSGGETALIWGDLVHFPEIQAARPEAATGYDVDPVTAAETRRRVLETAAAERLRVAGMHLRWPGVARVERRPDNYAILPG